MGIHCLIRHLKLKYDIEHEFDWYDWDDFISTNRERYGSLQDLFLIVAFFFQFGISVPVDLKTSFLGNANRLTIIRAIQQLGDLSPIVLVDDGEKLELKSELIASMYLENERAELAKSFFRGFLKEINNETSAKLFRSMRKLIKLDEFKTSIFSTELTPTIALEIVEDYLNTNPPDRIKMLNEKGIALLYLNRTLEAIEIFEFAAKADKDNAHSRDQLAKIYAKDESTVSLAIKKYLEILNLSGHYAIVRIQHLIRRFGDKAISKSDLPYTDNYILSVVANLNTHLKIQLIRECFLSHEADLAKGILAIAIKDMTAKEFYILSHSMPLSPATLDLKKEYFQLAASLSRDSDNYFLFTIDYSVFLFEIGEFHNSQKCIELLKHDMPDKISDIESSYLQKIRHIEGVFISLPKDFRISKSRIEFLSPYLEYSQKYLYKPKNYLDTISVVVTLNKVRRLSKKTESTYLEATRLLAYAYGKYAGSNWNNLSEQENREIAYNLFNQLLEARYWLNKDDIKCMLDNIISIGDKPRLIHGIDLIRNLFETHPYRRALFLFNYRRKIRNKLRHIA